MRRHKPISRFHAAINRRRWDRTRRAALDRDGWRCRKCSRPGRLEVDHIKPLRFGGNAYSLENAQTLCRRCHIEKSRGESRRPLTPAEARWRALVQGVL